MITKVLRTLPLAIFALLTIGCANPSITNVNAQAISTLPSGPIYVARFEGRTDFVDEATDMFVMHLEKESRRSVVQGSSVRIESEDIVGAGNIAQTDHALAKARQAGAKVLIVGKVTSHQTGGMINGFTTIRIYDTSTGHRLGTIHRPSGLLVAHSEHQCVMKSAERVAEEAAKSFR